MGDNTLQGYVPGDFGKTALPPMTLKAEVSEATAATTYIAHQFSMPTGFTHVNVRAAYVENGDGDSQTGLSLVLRDAINSRVIHSETSARIKLGTRVSPLSQLGVSASTRVHLELKNETGASLTSRPEGMMVIDLE